VRRASLRKGSAEFQECVEAAAKKAQFKKTQQGGTLSFGLVFR
jgi:hypothetical protein